MAVLIGLFFVSQEPVPAGEPPVAEERAVAVETLRRQLEQRDATIRLLTENLAIARTESDLFQRRWTEAQLRAQTLGMDLADADVTNLQRQVIESIRALYLAEAEQHRLLEQLTALATAVESGADPSVALAAARQAIAERTRTGLAAAEPVATLESARIVDVNEVLRVVVLNVGSEQGARVGMPFLALRGDRVVAELRVIEARRHVCGAIIESGDPSRALRHGDEVRVARN